MAFLQVVSAIASSMVAVQTQLEALFRLWEIDSTELIDTKITPFGAGRFLVNVIFTGGYLLKSTLGLSSSIIFSFGRILENGLGLESVFDFILSRNRPLENGLGMSPTLEFEYVDQV